MDIEFDSCSLIQTDDNGYNGSIEAYEDSYIFFYRREDDVCKAPFYINYTFLTKQGVIDNVVLNLNYGREGFHPLNLRVDEYDPRIIQWGGEGEYALFSVYRMNLHARLVTIKNREVYFNQHVKMIGYNFNLHHCEKNWMPFRFKDDLYMVYSINPHMIVKFYRTGLCEKICETPMPIKWHWGEPSGGTQAVRINEDEYLTFFHSFKTGDRSDHTVPREYFAGAYTFEAKPPFRILRMTPEPLYWDGIYQTMTKSPHLVVFPSGLIHENGILSMTYGDNDGATYLAKLPVERALNMMQKV